MVVCQHQQHNSLPISALLVILPISLLFPFPYFVASRLQAGKMGRGGIVRRGEEEREWTVGSTWHSTNCTLPLFLFLCLPSFSLVFSIPISWARKLRLRDKILLVTNSAKIWASVLFLKRSSPANLDKNV